jgi:hypothetical protein
LADRPNLAADLLRGAGEIALVIYGSDDKATRRRLYHEQDKWPVFQLSENGILFALRSRIQALVEAKSAAKEAQILAATKAALAPKAVKAKPRPRRRARSSTNKAA